LGFDKFIDSLRSNDSYLDGIQRFEQYSLDRRRHNR
jgi:hypothetical protein